MNSKKHRIFCLVSLLALSACHSMPSPRATNTPTPLSQIETTDSKNADRTTPSQTQKKSALSGNRAPVARKDYLKTDASKLLVGNLFKNNFHGPDFDGDGDSFKVHSINGSTDYVQKKISLPSGATLTVSKDGDFSYDPRKGFGFLTIPGSSSADRVEYQIIDTKGKVSKTALALFAVIKERADEVISQR